MLKSHTFLGQLLISCLISFCFGAFAENPDFDPLKIAVGEEKNGSKDKLSEENSSKPALVSSVNFNGPNVTVIIRNTSRKSTSGQFRVKFLNRDGSLSRSELISAYVEPNGSKEFGFYLSSDETSVTVEPIEAMKPRAVAVPRKAEEEVPQESFDIEKEQPIDFESLTDN
jgi:hypothetical protein